MIKNPLTNRRIKIGGPTYKELINAGYVHKDNSLVLSIKPNTTPIVDKDSFGIVMSFLRMRDIVSLASLNSEYATYVMYNKHIHSIICERDTFTRDKMRYAILSDHYLLLSSKTLSSIYTDSMNTTIRDIMFWRQCKYPPDESMTIKDIRIKVMSLGLSMKEKITKQNKSEAISELRKYI